MAETRYQEAIEALAAAFGDRLGLTRPGGEAFLSPAGVEEARLMAEISNRYSVPLVPLGAGTGNGSTPEGPTPERGVLVRFDLMQDVRLPENDETWVEAGPGASWLNLDDELRARARGLAVYPTSAPRATVGGWLATDGLGVGSFEFGRLRENVLSATVVSARGDLREIPGEDLASLSRPEGSGSIVVGARLRTRRADADAPLAAAFGSAANLAATVESLSDSRPPLWHLAFLNPVLARARHLEGEYLLFGAYPREREEGVAGPLGEAVGKNRGRLLCAADAYRVWGERFFPVTPSAASVPEVVREVVPLTEVRDALARAEGRGTVATQGSVSRSGEALLLTFEEERL
ncbi:FAD-binding protein [Rubrobacter tropicus]|uniref:FAD-binding protein n=1 Tax=Rubrobacter tropicus TaxID=2653851 RepID=A0A6G8QE19_9ACTN|nr:FAD-binding oxidoreductase [Rubrobacter tropicus]QIN84754.1 FAD-binding protein [Rubrobacter tropicus]